MDKAELKRLKSIGSSLQSQFNIGRRGITQDFIETIDDYLDKYEIVKISSLKAEDKDELSNIAEELADKVQAYVIDKRGFKFVLYRKNENRN